MQASLVVDSGVVGAGGGTAAAAAAAAARGKRAPDAARYAHVWCVSLATTKHSLFLINIFKCLLSTPSLRKVVGERLLYNRQFLWVFAAETNNRAPKVPANLNPQSAQKVYKSSRTERFLV